MTYSTIVNILKVNDAKKGISKRTGNPYDMQDCECLLINSDGSVNKVGVLRVPDSLRDKVAVGMFTASFSLDANYKTREIEARLVDIVPLPPKPAAVAPAPAGKASVS